MSHITDSYLLSQIWSFEDFNLEIFLKIHRWWHNTQLDTNQSLETWNIINKIIHIAVVQELTRDDHENFKKINIISFK